MSSLLLSSILASTARPQRKTLRLESYAGNASEGALSPLIIGITLAKDGEQLLLFARSHDDAKISE